MIEFDFDGSLRLAKDLREFADRLADFATEFTGVQTPALDNWLGWYGDWMRARRDSVDQELMHKRLDVSSDEWVSLWQEAVDLWNDEAHAEASDEHRAWIAQQRSIAETERVDFIRFRNLNPQLTEPPNVQWLNEGAPFTIEPPRSAARPVNFSPVEDPFVEYRRQDYDLVATYRANPTAWPGGIVL